jgi:hypothetical protein
MNNNSIPQKIRRTNYSTTTVIIIVSVLSLIFIGIYLYNYYKDLKATLLATNITKVAASCPDYWDSIGSGKCQNSKRLGSCSNTPDANIMDFSTDIFTNKSTGDYSKCKWSKACNISWSNIDRVC